MKTEKLKEYKPNYARAVKVTAMTVAVSTALASGVACYNPTTTGNITVDDEPTPAPTEDVTEMGYVAPDYTPEPDEYPGGDEDLTLDGEVMIEDTPAPGGEELTLMGDVMVEEIPISGTPENDQEDVPENDPEDTNEGEDELTLLGKIMIIDPIH